MHKLTIQQAYTLSTQLYSDGRCAEAANVLLRILEAKNDLRPVLEQLGLALLSEQRIGLAIAVAERLVTLSPKTIAEYSNAINLYKRALILQSAESITKSDYCGNVNEITKKKGGEQPPQVVILCGGESSRWNNHLDVKNKQLVRVEGEILIQRTLRLINNKEAHAIDVIVPKGETSDYQKWLPPEVRIHVVGEPTSGITTPAWKYLSSRGICNFDRENIILLGDVWFSEHAVDVIFGIDIGDWNAFGRSHPSDITGCPYGEIFAIKFQDAKMHFETVELLDLLYKAGLCIESASGWALLQLINNQNPNIRSPGKSFVNIDDFTEDFDFPVDFDRWVFNLHAAKRRKGTIIT